LAKAILMADLDRQTVREHDRRRKALRESLLSDAEQARHDLHPKTLAQRWTTRQMARLADAGAEARQKVAKKAPLIGIGAAAILLFAARKPISEWLNSLRNRKANQEGDEQ
jgi:hypothetical protein